MTSTGRDPWSLVCAHPGSIGHADQTDYISLSRPEGPFRCPGSLSRLPFKPFWGARYNLAAPLWHSGVYRKWRGLPQALCPMTPMQPSSVKCHTLQTVWQFLDGCCLQDLQGYRGVYAMYTSGLTCGGGCGAALPETLTDSGSCFLSHSTLSSPL